jgi:hypothetical protein
MRPWDQIWFQPFSDIETEGTHCQRAGGGWRTSTPTAQIGHLLSYRPFGRWHAGHAEALSRRIWCHLLVDWTPDHELGALLDRISVLWQQQFLGAPWDEYQYEDASFEGSAISLRSASVLNSIFSARIAPDQSEADFQNEEL